MDMASPSNHKSIYKAIDPEIMTTSLSSFRFSNGEEFESTRDISKVGNMMIKESKMSELSMLKDIECNPILKEIFNSLSFMPVNVIKTIGDYDNYHDSTINEFYNRTKNKFKKIIKGEIKFNLYTFTFTFNLLKLVNDVKKEFPLYHQFWNDLARLLFKYALLMRRRFATNDRIFERSVKNIKNIMIIVEERIELSLDIFKLQFMDDFDFSIFKDLVKCEIFDHPKLLAIFAKSIIDKEGNLLIDIDEIEKIYCNGNFNNNLLLKMMLIQFAFGASANEQMIRRGWITSKNVDSRGDYSFALTLHHIYSKREREGEEHECKVDEIERMWPFCLNQSIIKFFLENNLRFQIDSSCGLVQFLRRLEYIGGLPEGSSIKKIIKIEDADEGVYKWDEDIFKMYLAEERDDFDFLKEKGISPEEYQRYIKLVE